MMSTTAGEAINTNELVEICISKSKPKCSFHLRITLETNFDEISDPFNKLTGNCHSPSFTYPFFGEEESLVLPNSVSANDNILLVIDGSLRAHGAYFLAASCESLEEHCAVIEARLKEFAEKAGFAEEALVRFSNWPAFKETVNAAQSIEFSSSSKIVKLNASVDTAHAQLFQRLQLLLPFYIEAATFIPAHCDPNWSAFLSLSPAGDILALATCYSYFYFPEGLRQRVSQVLVMPGHQHLRNGGKLYGALLDRFRCDEGCKEVCVEDPTDRFERMRGVVEMQIIKKELEEGKQELKEIARVNKIPLMQVRRLNNALAHLKTVKKAKSDSNARLETKKWLLKRFSGELDGLEVTERKAKLDELYEIELEEFIYPVLERIAEDQ